MLKICWILPEEGNYFLIFKFFIILISKISYCPENVLFWRDVQRFKKSNKKNRNKMAQVLINTYMKQTSPVELNLPSELSKLIPNLEIQANETTPVDANIFQQFELHCLNDLCDIFTRFKASTKYGNN